MRISVINLTHGLLSDSDIQTAIRAVNRQIEEDFSPYWNISGKLRLEGSSENQPNVHAPEDMQGEAIIYLWDEADIPNALGYHEANYRGIPYGFVFIDIASEMGDNWTVTFSHEALELLGDRQANLLVNGPNPNDRRRRVYHWREMCDAVQNETYTIDGVEVSNFVLPLYFTSDAEPGSRNDFLGTGYWSEAKQTYVSLDSFGVNPGGYIGFYNPKTGKNETFFGPDPAEIDNPENIRLAEHRQERRNKARMARRGNRYSGLGEEFTDFGLGLKTKTELTTIKKKDVQVVKIGKSKLKISCKESDLTINTDLLPLIDDANKNKGYFSYDIRANAGFLNEDLKKLQLQEIGGFEIVPIDVDEEITTPTVLRRFAGIKSINANDDVPKTHEVEISLEVKEDEPVLAMVEIEGVILWHEPIIEKGQAKFTFSVQAQSSTGQRGSFIGKALKTTVRFVKHKIIKKVKDKLSSSISGYLAETIESLAFRKGKIENGALLEFKVFDQPGKNGILGEVVPLNQPVDDKKYLLLIHGIFSSPKGAFGDLLKDYHQDKLLKRLSERYEKIIAYDHWTVAKSTLENATDLLKFLPKKCQLDIVCHSRGAGVTRCLLEHTDVAKLLKDEGYEIQVGKVVFVAGACQGSELAEPKNISRLVNAFSVFSSLSTAYFPISIAAALLKAVQYGVKNFPGIVSMSPNSPIIKALNKAGFYKGSQYLYMRSNFEPDGKLARLLDEVGLDKFVFKDKWNDGIVPYEGAGTFDEVIAEEIKPVAGAEFGVAAKDNVFHTRFFRQKRTRLDLLKFLN